MLPAYTEGQNKKELAKEIARMTGSVLVSCIGGVLVLESLEKDHRKTSGHKKPNSHKKAASQKRKQKRSGKKPPKKFDKIKHYKRIKRNTE